MLLFVVFMNLHNCWILRSPCARFSVVVVIEVYFLIFKDCLFSFSSVSWVSLNKNYNNNKNRFTSSLIINKYRFQKIMTANIIITLQQQQNNNNDNLNISKIKYGFLIYFYTYDVYWTNYNKYILLLKYKNFWKFTVWISKAINKFCLYLFLLVLIFS